MLSGGLWTTIGGDGRGSSYSDKDLGKFNMPKGVAVDSAGAVYVADTGNDLLRKLSGGVWSTIEGNFTYHQYGKFLNPVDVAVDSVGIIYVADTLSIHKLSDGA